LNKLYIAGIGPGDPDSMTIKVARTLREADVIVGYPVYVDLIKDLYPEKEFVTTPMTKETERCRLALDLAEAGRRRF